MQSLPFNRHIKTAEQRIIMHQYTVIGILAYSGLLNLVQRRAGMGGHGGPVQSPPRCTKCNNPPINGQCTSIILLDMVL